MNKLAKGALKSAVASVCGVILGLPTIDPEHFSITNLSGLGRLCIACAWLIIVGEARFFKQWAISENGNGSTKDENTKT